MSVAENGAKRQKNVAKKFLVVTEIPYRPVMCSAN